VTESERASSAIVTLPNMVSFVRLLMVPVFLWRLLVEDEVAAAGWLLGIIGATDWIDGYLARRLDQVSELGKLLDPVADRLAVASAVVGGLIAGVLAPWFAWALIIREALIAGGALFVGARVGRKLAVRDLGKLATLLLYAAIAWLFIGIGTPLRWLEIAGWLVGIPGLALYWIVGFQYLNDARVLLDEESRPASAG
jgi:cardiolipin synthase